MQDSVGCTDGSLRYAALLLGRFVKRCCGIHGAQERRCARGVYKHVSGHSLVVQLVDEGEWVFLRAKVPVGVCLGIDDFSNSNTRVAVWRAFTS